MPQDTRSDPALRPSASTSSDHPQPAETAGEAAVAQHPRPAPAAPAGGSDSAPEASPPDGGDAQPQTKKDDGKPPAARGKRKKLLLGLAIFFVLAGVVYGLLWLFVFSVREKTDDAYVSGNLVTITPQVAGTVVAIMAEETQLVQAGNPVVRLDPADASLAVDQARTALAETVRQVRQAYEQALQSSAVVGEREADLQRARQDYERRLPLAKARAVPQEELTHAKNALDAAQAALTAAQKQAQAAKAMVEGTSIEHHPSVERAKANFRQAYLNAQRNELVSPVTGYVAKRSVQVGQRVVPGNALMSIVPLADLWVDANFKERELRDIRIGQPATIEADIYGGHVEYHGRVVGLGAGTGSAFSLLPPQNASGNWIKVVQRVPVRISLDANELARNPLRVGLSATVTVDTHDRSGPVLAQTPANATPYSTDVYDESHGEADRIADEVVRANLGPPLRTPRPAP